MPLPGKKNMDRWQQALQFLIVDGSLLIGLFILITMLVLVTQQLAVGRSIEAGLARAGLWKGAVLAAVGGTVTPFCSCSTVPVLTGMLRSNIRLAASFTFLIASPVINEGVIVLLAGGPGLLSVALYVLLAGFICVVAGVVVDRSGMLRFVKISQDPLELPDGYLGGHEQGRPPLQFVLRAAWAATRMELRQLLPYLVVGLLVGAAIYGYVPSSVLEGLNRQFSPFVLIPLVAVLAVPIYVSPMAAVPIGFALLEKGMGPGAVFAFLIAGAGTSLPEMIMLGRLFRWQLVLTHMAVVLIAAVLLGLAAQLYLPHF